MPNVDVIRYKGIRYRRYPDSDKRAERSYYVPGIGDRQKYGLGRLHEEIWKDNNGPIPEGGHVHHEDHDPLNNDPSNLVCLDGDEHLRHHAAETDYRTPERLAHLEEIRPLAAAWHSTPEGLAWHSENGKRAWESREPLPAECDQCGKPFASITRRDDDRFCSNACKSKWRRAAGLDDIDCACHRCGSAFRTNKYKGSAHCSRSCGSRCGKSGATCPGIQPVGG